MLHLRQTSMVLNRNQIGTFANQYFAAIQESRSASRVASYKSNHFLQLVATQFGQLEYRWQKGCS